MGSSRFQPGEGPSRGLLRDYEPSDAIRMQLFEALVRGEGADTGGGAAGVCDKTRASEDHQPAAAPRARARAGARASEARAEM